MARNEEIKLQGIFNSVRFVDIVSHETTRVASSGRLSTRKGINVVTLRFLPTERRTAGVLVRKTANERVHVLTCGKDLSRR